MVLTSAGGVGTAYPAPQALLVAPPPLAEMGHPWFEVIFDGGRDKTLELATRHESLADFLGVHFFDAGSVISTDGVDGIHFTEQDNTDLGEALADDVRAILQT